jgi:hypothetical protein
MLAALVTLNPVGMLCFNQPIPPNLPPLVPSLLCSPSNWQSCIGRRSSRRRRRCRRHRARQHTGRRGGCNGVPVLRARSRRRCWPRSRQPRRLAPTCPAAPSPGLECKHLPVVACVNAIQLLSQQLHAAASRRSGGGGGCGAGAGEEGGGEWGWLARLRVGGGGGVMFVRADRQGYGDRITVAGSRRQGHGERVTATGSRRQGHGGRVTDQPKPDQKSSRISLDK